MTYPIPRACLNSSLGAATAGVERTHRSPGLSYRAARGLTPFNLTSRRGAGCRRDAPPSSLLERAGGYGFPRVTRHISHRSAA